MKTEVQIRKELMGLAINGALEGAKKALEEEKEKALKILHKYPMTPGADGVWERVEAQVRIDEADRVFATIVGIKRDLRDLFLELFAFLGIH